jgi:mobilome CxxCx(11)CxxC protein
MAQQGTPDRSFWDLARDAYGTAWIFERRGRVLGRKLRALAFFGLVGPLLVGAIHGAFGSYPTVVDWATGVIGVAVAVISLWALVAKWDTAMAYASESQTDNSRLSRELVDLARMTATESGAEPDRRAQLRADFNTREAQDQRQDVSPQEKRAGYRAGLLQFKQACGGPCSRVPESMTPTTCGVCGRFPKGFAE